MKSLFALLALPLILLNMLGGVVGGIWLAVLGEWPSVFFGLAYLFGGAIVIGLLMAPMMLFMVPAAALAKRSLVLAGLVALPGVLWVYALLAASCVIVFSGIAGKAEGITLPYILWGYAVALAPWTYMASKEDEDGFSGVMVFFAQLGTISMMAAVLIDSSDATPARLIYWFAPALIIAMALQLIMIVAGIASARRGPY